MTPAKACTMCGETLPLTDYSPNRHHSDGRQSACKMCVADRIHWARAAGTYNDEPQRRAYTKALGALRDLHRAEFQRLYGQALRAEKSRT